MVRLSSAVLMRAHRFLLEIHAAGDVETLRAMIPKGLSRLIPCDRASINVMDIADGRKQIAPTPVPTWWPRLGQVYQRHLMDHPIWDSESGPRLNRVIGFKDKLFADRWLTSTLYNDYFVPLGVKHQLSALLCRQNARYIGMAVNRSDRDFKPEDARLLELLSAHIGLAWRNASVLDSFRRSAQIQGRIAGGTTATLTNNPEYGAIRSHPRPEISIRPSSAKVEFTRREVEILNWLREGKRNSEIGVILGISVRTVGKHLEHLFAKLGVETRTAAVRTSFAIQDRGALVAAPPLHSIAPGVRLL